MVEREKLSSDRHKQQFIIGLVSTLLLVRIQSSRFRQVQQFFWNRLVTYNPNLSSYKTLAANISRIDC